MQFSDHEDGFSTRTCFFPTYEMSRGVGVWHDTLSLVEMELMTNASYTRSCPYAFCKKQGEPVFGLTASRTVEFRKYKVCLMKKRKKEQDVTESTEPD